MASVADLVAKLRIDTSQFASGLEAAAAKVNTFGSKMASSLRVVTEPIDVQKFKAIQQYADQNNVSMDKARKQLGYTRGEYRHLTEAHRQYNAEIQKSKFGFKDVARIVQGIIVAKIFYGGLQAIRQATNAVWEFSKALEYSQITYANLFGDMQLSNEFVNVLQDYAAETVFSFTEAEEAARRLLSYGVQYKNVMYIMQGVMAGATVTGNKQNIERISRALGQIYTKGRLMGEEMRQLAEAGVPAYDILIDKLGLTQKQLQNLGRESIPASKAINALVDGINERFGNVVNAAAFTTTGLINKIQDNALMLANGMFEPVLNVIKSFLGTFANWLAELRNIYNKSGIGGVFENIVPPHMQTTVRTFVANIINMTQSLASGLKPVGVILAYIGQVLMNVFNMIAPVITFINTFLSALASKLTGANVSINILSIALTVATGALTIFLANLLRVGIVKVFTSAVLVLGKAVRWLGMVLATHPVLFFLSLLAVGVAGLAATNNKLGQSIRNLVGNFTSLSGVDPDNILLPESKERAADLGKFNNKLDDTSDAMNKLADKTGKAAKAGKQLLSFDEVFKINTPDESAGSGAGIGDALDDALAGLDAVGGVEMPSFDDFALNLKSALFDSITERLTSTSLGGLIGGILGAAIGSLFGQPLLGAKIGAAAGAFAGFFWKEISAALEKVGFTQEGNTAAVIGGIIGATIGSLLGGPAGGIIGAAIGVLATGLTNMLWTGIATALGKDEDATSKASVSSAVGAAIGAIIGGLLGGPGGAIIGASIGLFAGGLVGLFWEEIKKAFTTGEGLSTGVGYVIGTGIGAVFGGLLGGPAGAVIGAGIGYFATRLVNWLWSTLASSLGKDESSVQSAKMGTNWGAAIGAVVGGILGGPGGALIGAGLGALVGGIVGLFWENIKNAFTTGEGMGKAVGYTIGVGLGAIFGGLIGGPAGAIIGAGIGYFAARIVDIFWDSLSEYFSGQWKKMADNLTAIWGKVAEFFKHNGTEPWYEIGADIVAGILLGIGAAVVSVFEILHRILFEPIIDGIKKVFGINSPAESTKPIGGFIVAGIWEGIVNKLGWLLDNIGSWSTTVTKQFTDWVRETTLAFTGWITDNANALGSWVTNTSKSFATWRTNTWNGFTLWYDDTTKKFSGWSRNVITTVSTWSTNTVSSLGTWWSNTKTGFGTWYTDTLGKIRTWSTDTLNDFTTWSSDSATKFTNWRTETYNSFSTWFTQLGNSIKIWWGNSWLYTTWTSGWSRVSGWFTSLKTSTGTWFTGMVSEISRLWGSLWDTSKWKSGWDSVKTWFSNLLTSIGNWFTSIKTTVSNWWDGLWSNKKVTTNSTGGSFTIKQGHATGGIFNREHIARFAEGNKAEAVIPLENASAMQPFVDAISNGLMQSLMPAFAAVGSGSNGSQLPPMYVGTLIADERGLKELERKMRLIRIQEDARRGNR